MDRKNFVVIFLSFFVFSIALSQDFNLIKITAKKNEASLPTSSTTTKIEKDERFSSLLDQLKNSPGITLLQEGGRAQQASLFIRGGESFHTLVLLDDIPLNDPSSPAGGYNFTKIQNISFEKIEVLRGPQVVLYGQNALAGVVRLQSLDPKVGMNHSRIRGMGGSYNSWQMGMMNEGGFSQFGYGVGGQFEGSSGMKKGAIKPYREEDAAFKFFYNANENNRLRFAGQLQHGKNGIDRFGGPGGEDPNGEARSTEKFLRGEWESFVGESVELKTILGWRSLDRHYHFTDQDDLHYGGRIGDIGLKTKIAINENNMLWSGFDHSTELASFKEGPANSDALRKEASINSLYALHQWQLGAFSSRQGFRLQHHSFFKNTASYQWTPSYQMDSLGLVIEAGYGHGSSYPSLYQHYSPFAGSRDLKTEQSDSYEISFLKTTGFFSSQISLFTTDYTQLIQYDFATNRYMNAGAAKTYGAEFVLSQKIRSDWELQENYTWLRAYKKRSGEYLMRRPHHQANMAILWRPRDSFFWRGQLEYVGVRNDVGGVASSYMLAHTEIGIQQNKALRYGLQLSNILNHHYEAVSGYASPGRSIYASVQWDYDSAFL